MSTTKTLFLCAVVAAASAALGFWSAHRHDMAQMPSMTMEVTADTPVTADAEKKVLYWYDPMVPNQHFDEPGKSPFMDMELVPKYADEVDTAGVKIDPGVQQNLALRRAVVERMVLSQSMEAVGSLMFNERNIAIVQTRSNGFVERVYAHAQGDVVTKNEPLADLLIPDWAGAQLEYLALRNNGTPELLDASRQRLQLLGMPDELIRKVERSGKPHTIVTITSPIDGMIQTLDVRTGMSIGMGMTLAQIVGIDPVWLEIAVPESQAASVKTGQTLEARFSAYPGDKFAGRVITVLPETNADTRTLKVRAEFPNPDRRLRPGMFAQARIETANDEALLWVPTEAVIRTGKRDVVIVDKGEGTFLPVEVEIGPESSGKTVILRGLDEGQTIVASGQFLIDSEASLMGVLAKLDAPSDQKASPAEDVEETGDMKDTSNMENPAELHRGKATVKSIAGNTITLSHGPIPSLDWGPMTMPFTLPNPAQVESLKPGDHVTFAFTTRNGEFEIQTIEKAGATP